MRAGGRSTSIDTTDTTPHRERGSPVRKKQQPPSSSNVPIVYNYQNYPQSEPEKEDKKASSGFDLHVKLLMLGDSGVGKSSLVLQYANEEFTTNFVTTIGIDYKIKLLNSGKTVIKLQIWDTVGRSLLKYMSHSPVMPLTCHLDLCALLVCM